MADATVRERLNAETASLRLSNLDAYLGRYRAGEFPFPKDSGNVNNHIHTTYSFSPYSPTLAATLAWENGLRTAGIMDHDSVSGAEEFIKAGEMLGIATTVGMECRVSMYDTPFSDRRINNPDQNGIAYVAMHGIPHDRLKEVEEFIRPYLLHRHERNRQMVALLNRELVPLDVELDYERDILPLSQAHEGGSVTERHLLFAFAREVLCASPNVVSVLEDTLGLTLSDKQRALLSDKTNPYLEYDLLGVLKSSLIERIYVPAFDECPPLDEWVAFCHHVGAIPAYAYLGDVGDSVTGDKKTQKFEDDYLDELVAYLKDAGVSAITYMPTRNTAPQLERIRALCKKHGLFEISGEDINSPRQSFQNPLVASPPFAHLVEATWALIGHEWHATQTGEGLFTKDTTALSERITFFADWARNQFKEETK
ncbi:MAG: PHP domain-containing protein [Clostridia bacterium]|nr:PHP domain-containing protein [Clostridia bacterium]